MIPAFSQFPTNVSLPVAGECQKDSVFDYEDRPNAPVGL